MLKNYLTKEEFELEWNVKLISKKQSLWMRLTGWFITIFSPYFMIGMFTTYRLPFQKYGTIAHPDGLNPLKFPDVLEHELMHVEQQRTAWGLFKSALLYSLLPLPVFFSGRWFVEREPYLMDIRKGLFTPEQAADILWDHYAWCWPKSLMIKWFKEHK